MTFESQFANIFSCSLTYKGAIELSIFIPDYTEKGLIFLPSITEEMAQRIANNIIEIAKNDGGKPIAVCILDIKREEKCKISMDGVFSVSVILSFNKAYTAIIMECSTREVRNILENRGAAIADFPPNFTSLFGGIPIILPLANNQYVVGAIGVSGRTSEEDEALAIQGLEAEGIFVYKKE